MSYIGNTATQQAFTPAVDFFNGNGSTTAFTLSRPVASVAQVQAVISNVPQKPGDAFTVSGNTITFTSAPPSGTQNIYVYYTSPITQVIAPGQGTVGTDQIQNGAVIPADLSTGAPTWNTSGNLGLGLTPNTWRSNDKAVQVGGSTDYANFVGAGAGVTFGNNFYRDSGGFKYKNSYAAGRFDFDYTTSGGFSWNIAASGTAGNAITFTQAMTLDASGYLLVGKTTTSTSTQGAVIGGTSDLGFCSFSSSATSNSSITLQVYSTGAAANRFYVGYAGTVFATNTTISAISDIRFKENVRDLDAGLAEIMALQPRLYDWKEGKGADIKNARGFIAQEFEQVFPDMIDEWKDPAPEGEEPYKSVRADLIPVLVKAIQEQQATIAQLQADVATLKGQA
jgi:hypothetical protein